MPARSCSRVTVLLHATAGWGALPLRERDARATSVGILPARSGSLVAALLRAAAGWGALPLRERDAPATAGETPALRLQTQFAAQAFNELEPAARQFISRGSQVAPDGGGRSQIGFRLRE
jgi:hypothetical protein